MVTGYPVHCKDTTCSTSRRRPRSTRPTRSTESAPLESGLGAVVCLRLRAAPDAPRNDPGLAPRPELGIRIVSRRPTLRMEISSYVPAPLPPLPPLPPPLPPLPPPLPPLPPLPTLVPTGLPGPKPGGLTPPLP